jgi:DNA modification methylase/transcriptional regulator with XRE-family HTH domain/SAM-dependent methyltransferase
MTWTPHNAIKSRREQLGRSQTEVADCMGVSKSLLSQIESGARSATSEQVKYLSEALSYPSDLLMLGTGRLPDDVQGVLQNDAATAIALIRQNAESHVIQYPKSPPVIPVAGIQPIPEASLRLSKRITASKTTASYRAHSYHTKVPPDAIRPFIRAFTRPGETVYDPFCGSGMTGVAALAEGRNALLSDLSPAAVHIARNYTAYCDPDQLTASLKIVAAMVTPTMEWLYRPIGDRGLVEYTTWSDIFKCPKCRSSILYWHMVQSKIERDSDAVVCTSCGHSARKGEMEWLGEKAVQSHTSNSGSRLIDTHEPTSAELRLIEDSSNAPIPYWVPNIAFGAEREMWRGGHRSMGIDTVEGFFTRRNLHALAALRHAIVCCSSGRVREALMFAFTAAVNRASKRYQWNAKRPTNVMTGTLYISSLRYEWNVWSLFSRKISDVIRYYRNFPVSKVEAHVFQHSASELDCVPDQSVDMVFMDPPFGSNIFYADASILWEAWLGTLTDENAEIVVNKSRKSANGGKSLANYRDLMAQSFAHVGRILKPGGRAVLAFSNSNDLVWKAIQDGLGIAGFDTESVHILDKGQPSIKGVKGRTGKESVTTYDLLLCLRHSSTPSIANVLPNLPPDGFVKGEVLDGLAENSCRTDEIYSRVIRAVLEHKYSVVGITMPFVEEVCKEIGASMNDGTWQLAKTVPSAKRLDFVSGYISDPEKIPKSNSTTSPSAPPVSRSVDGGRSSPFYLAHSYHTKVPPESIAPFIEHFTSRGDVVLDPFCGSGMTGVAAALAGRRAILNDLSPAAIHLAWNHTRPCAPEDLQAAFDELDSAVAARFSEMYQTHDESDLPGLIHWTLWSTKHKCPLCEQLFALWDAVDKKEGRLGKSIKCPHCSQAISRNGLDNLGSEPAWIAYEAANGKRFEKAASDEDRLRATAFQKDDITGWFPKVLIESDREMYIRCALGKHGVATVADFYTPRNLAALSLLWAEIGKVKNERVKRALAFAFTNTAWHGTRMRRFNARGGQRPLTGTLYIPQLSSEANVLEVMRNKIRQLLRYYRAYRPLGVDLPAISLGSATSLALISDESIDYVFTDPPFGSNLFYADCNLIWEAWLGRLTHVEDEAVVNKSLAALNGGKSLADYTLLMSSAMSEIARVLKPGGWATVVFHNTDAEVWRCIRDAAEHAGFSFHEAASLNRKQQSHKGYKGRSEEEDVAHFDVIFNLRKETRPQLQRKPESVAQSLEQVIAEIAKDKTIANKGLQAVHAEVMRRMASVTNERFVDYAAVRAAWAAVRPNKKVS